MGKSTIVGGGTATIRGCELYLRGTDTNDNSVFYLMLF
jgi:hypothetical protein